MTGHFDVAVLGAGSAGERLAGRLARSGRSVAVVERRLVGGECPFFACVPSKAMLISAAARATISRAVEVGATSRPLVLQPGDEAWVRAVHRRDAIAAQHDDSDHEKALRESGAVLYRGEGRVTGPGAMEVHGHGPAQASQRLTFDELVIATGSSASIPDVPGLAEAQPWTSEEAWTARRRPASLVVLGGGAVGCEIAQAFARFGTEVTLLDHSPVGAGLEPEMAADLAEVLRADDVDVREGAAVESITRSEGRVHVTTAADGEVVAEQIVVAVGTSPVVGDLGLQALGLDPDDLDIDDRMRVRGADGVWAIGDVTGIAPFTHAANYQADVAAANLLGQDRRADHRAIPRMIYTTPEVAATGLTREQAEAQGIDVVSGTFDLADTARASVDAESTGRVVLVADRARRILVGASVIAPSAGEAISEFTVAIRGEVPLDVLVDVVHPFPTWSEGFGPAIGDMADRIG